MLRKRPHSLYRRVLGHGHPKHSRALSVGTPVTVGIRREDPKRIWERRAPLSPKAVKELVEGGVKVEFEHCDRRVFRDDEYLAVGAKLKPHLKDAHIVIGIKETPLDEVTQDMVSAPHGTPNSSTSGKVPQTHMMFSHTAKGQPYNTPLLAKYVDRNQHAPSAAFPRLIDYELLTDDVSGKRTVGFGYYAGVPLSDCLTTQSPVSLNPSPPWRTRISKTASRPRFSYVPSLLFLSNNAFNGRDGQSTPRPHTHPSLESIRNALKSISTRIRQGGTPPVLGPFVIGLTGTGNVTQGCLDILNELPIQKVEVEELDKLVKDPNTPLNKIYLVHALPKDYLVRLDGQPYERAHYYASPHSYESVFCEKVAPYLTLFLNGVGWAQDFPRLMTNEQLAIALARARPLGGARFTNIGDISCDIEGGLQFLTRPTTLSDPFYKITPPALAGAEGVLPDVQMMSVDILPASLPLDASYHFSRVLLPYVESLVRGYQAGTSSAQDRDDPYTAALDRATIAQHGKLKDAHAWLGPAVRGYYDTQAQAQAAEAEAAEAKPMRSFMEIVEEQVEQQEKSARAERRARKREERERAREQEREREAQAFDTIPEHLKLDKDRESMLRKVIAAVGKQMDMKPDTNPNSNSTPHPNSKPTKHILMLGSGMVAGPAIDEIARRKDVRLVVVSLLRAAACVEPLADPTIMTSPTSLLPVKFHTAVAKACLKHQKHMVTASYVSDEMQALHSRAKAGNVLFLNEVGLDPGIDHCSALDLIGRIKARGQRIDSFISFCGGLPAPDVDHTPLRYKFSWSPMGVLLAGLNSSQYLLNRETRSTPAGELFKHAFPDVPVTDEFSLEGLPNRDSLKYLTSYALHFNKMRTFVRGTLRYPGFSSLMESFRSLGFFNQKDKIYLKHWHEYVQLCIAHHTGTVDNPKAASDALGTLIPKEKMTALHDALEWLGLLTTPLGYSKPLPPLPAEPMYPLDIFAYILSQQLAYQPLERDMVVLAHEIVSRDKANNTYVHTSSLIEYGTPTESAMARTVGLPVAIAALNVADGQIRARGVQRPTTPDIYVPILRRLEELGVKFKEETRRYPVGHSEPVRTVEAALLGRTPASLLDASPYDEDEMQTPLVL
ncbi:hypothetical protein H0H92_006747 [Tricholoma furcatifolium]|nr:hypothetical protein H0H92_006747 [Tricholoma furcatifolium]